MRETLLYARPAVSTHAVPHPLVRHLISQGGGLESRIWGGERFETGGVDVRWGVVSGKWEVEG